MSNQKTQSSLIGSFSFRKGNDGGDGNDDENPNRKKEQKLDDKVAEKKKQQKKKKEGEGQEEDEQIIQVDNNPDQGPASYVNIVDMMDQMEKKANCDRLS